LESLRVDKHFPNRQSVRLRNFDYASNGACSITICTHHRECLFGDVADGNMVLSEMGRIVAATWQEIPNHFPSVFLDAFVVMPNHLHGILVIDYWRTGTPWRAPTIEAFRRPVPGSINTVVRSFKAASTRRVREQIGDPFFKTFQRGFHENVITSPEELVNIRGYIIANPGRWHEDEENPTKP
jgi:putative transposase